LTVNEVLDLTGVARPAWREMDRANLAEAPVRQVKRILVFGGKSGAIPEGRPGWRARTDVHHGAETVYVVIGPFAVAVAKPEFRPADDMIDACRAVPGIADVPLHIGIMCKEST